MDAIQSIAKIIQPISTVTGEVGNLVSGIEKGKEISSLTNAQNKLLNMSPEQLSQLVNRGAAPLSAGLTQSVTNAVQGADAERGLATSPGIFSADLAQALAPYMQQNQNTALQALLAKYQLPISYGNTILGGYNQPTNMTSAIMKLLQNYQRPSNVPSDPNAFLNLIWGDQTSTPGLTDTPIDTSQGATA